MFRGDERCREARPQQRESTVTDGFGIEFGATARIPRTVACRYLHSVAQLLSELPRSFLPIRPPLSLYGFKFRTMRHDPPRHRRTFALSVVVERQSRIEPQIAVLFIVCRRRRHFLSSFVVTCCRCSGDSSLLVSENPFATATLKPPTGYIRRRSLMLMHQLSDA